MNCREAHELFGLVPDLSEDHPQRKLLEWHVLGCESCAAEYRIWLESEDTIQSLAATPSEEQAEAINRKVMDRIYAESPWLAPDVRENGYSTKMRNRSIVWAACFLSIFLLSTIIYIAGGMLGDQEQGVSSVTGIIPAAVAATDSEALTGFTFTLPMESRGIVEPFAVQLGPEYPQYWMLLSTAGMVLALISWRSVRGNRR